MRHLSYLFGAVVLSPKSTQSAYSPVRRQQCPAHWQNSQSHQHLSFQILALHQNLGPFTWNTLPTRKNAIEIAKSYLATPSLVFGWDDDWLKLTLPWGLGNPQRVFASHHPGGFGPPCLSQSPPAALPMGLPCG